MSKPEETFDRILSQLLDEFENTSAGPMMSSPGIRYKNKVFAFFHNDSMCFKLGNDYDIGAHGVDTFTHLSPFKNKPPMRAWYFVQHEDANRWEELARVALEKMQKQLDK